MANVTRGLSGKVKHGESRAAGAKILVSQKVVNVQMAK